MKMKMNTERDDVTKELEKLVKNKSVIRKMTESQRETLLFVLKRFAT